METKQGILKDNLDEYVLLDKVGKKTLLDRMVTVTHMHRKAILRGFKTLQMTHGSEIDYRGAPVVYGPSVTAALKTVWSAANEI